MKRFFLYILIAVSVLLLAACSSMYEDLQNKTDSQTATAAGTSFESKTEVVDLTPFSLSSKKAESADEGVAKATIKDGNLELTSVAPGKTQATVKGKSSGSKNYDTLITYDVTVADEGSIEAVESGFFQSKTLVLDPVTEYTQVTSLGTGSPDYTTSDVVDIAVDEECDPHKVVLTSVGPGKTDVTVPVNNNAEDLTYEVTVAPDGEISALLVDTGNIIPFTPQSTTVDMKATQGITAASTASIINIDEDGNESPVAAADQIVTTEFEESGNTTLKVTSKKKDEKGLTGKTYVKVKATKDDGNAETTDTDNTTLIYDVEVGVDGKPEVTLLKASTLVTVKANFSACTIALLYDEGTSTATAYAGELTDPVYKWLLDGSLLTASGNTCTVNTLSQGSHTLTVIVSSDDEEITGSASYVITID